MCGVLHTQVLPRIWVMCSEPPIMLLLKTEVELKFIYTSSASFCCKKSSCSVMSPGLKPVPNKSHVLRCLRGSSKRRMWKRNNQLASGWRAREESCVCTGKLSKCGIILQHGIPWRYGFLSEHCALEMLPGFCWLLSSAQELFRNNSHPGPELSGSSLTVQQHRWLPFHWHCHPHC